MKNSAFSCLVSVIKAIVRVSSELRTVLYDWLGVACSLDLTMNFLYTVVIFVVMV